MTSRELGLQKLTKDAVVEVGGFGQVISHRFIVGVPDLLLKVPRRQACILEVKQREILLKKDEFEPDVTVKQFLNLGRWAKSGMPSGVLSFLRGPKGTLFAAIYPASPDWKATTKLVAKVSDHFSIDKECRGVVPLVELFIHQWEHPDEY